MGKNLNMGTYTLTTTGGDGGGNYLISSADGVSVIALKLAAGGTATVTGSAKIGTFGNSTSIALVAGEPTIFTNDEAIDGLTISVTVGTVLAITNQ